MRCGWMTLMLLLMTSASLADEVPLTVSALPAPAASPGSLVAPYGFDEGDVRRIEKYPQVAAVLPSRTLSMRVRAGAVEHAAQIVGITASHLRLSKTKISEGRQLDDGDVYRLYSVAVISDSLARRLFEGSSAIGRLIRTDSSYFRVVGVASRDSVSGDVAFVPISTMRSRFGKIHIKRSAGTFEAESCTYDRVVILPSGEGGVLSGLIQDDLRRHQPDRRFRYQAAKDISVIRTD